MEKEKLALYDELSRLRRYIEKFEEEKKK